MNRLRDVLGITNKTEDNKFIPFLDFDSDNFELMHMDIVNIREKFKLSNPFLIKSTNGFNVFFLDKMTFDDCLELCKNCHSIDLNFIKYAIKKNNFTLRIGKDKNFIHSLNSEYSEHELSFAHYQFFNEFFKVDILNGFEITNLNFDELDEIELVMYMSKKYGYIQVD